MLYSKGEQLLDWIEGDIEDVFHIKNPQFFVRRKMVNDRQAIIDWIDGWVSTIKDKWIKYRMVEGNVFELKEYFPCPPDSLCEKHVRETLSIKSPCFYKMDSIVYSEKEVVKEMMYALRTGPQILWLRGPVEDPKGRKVYEVDPQYDEYGRTIPDGFVVLRA